MKKLLSLLLALTMVFTLVACGGEKDVEPENNTPAQEEPAGVKVELQSYPKEGETTAMKAVVYYPEDSGIKDSGYPEDKELKNLDENYRINIKSYQDDEFEDVRMKYKNFYSNYAETEFLGYKAITSENADYYNIAVQFEENRYMEIIVCSVGESDKSAKEIYESVPAIKATINTLEYLGEVEATRE